MAGCYYKMKYLYDIYSHDCLAGCILIYILNARPVARGECISPRAGAKLSNTRPAGEWSKCCNTS